MQASETKIKKIQSGTREIFPLFLFDIFQLREEHAPFETFSVGKQGWRMKGQMDIPYVRHYNLLLIWNRSWILTEHKVRITQKKLLKKRFWPSKMG